MLVLYDADRCPYCARARIALAEKGVEHEVVAVDLTDRPAWIYEKNETGRVPVLEEDAWLLPESSVILEYLEERYPEPPLLPADPAERALARVLIFRHDDFTGPYYALRRGEDGAAERFDAQLAKLEAVLAGREWLTGREYGLADIAYVPWVLRARDVLDVSLDAFPALRSWLDRLEERPAVAREVEPLPGSELPKVVSAEWLTQHLDDGDVVVGDVRGPNAHMRGHIAGSRPLVLGSPPPGADESTVAELAKEVALRLRRHGIDGSETLVLVDRGDGVGAMPAAQLAELAGHPRVAILLGGIAGWPGELAQGAVALEPVREASLEPDTHAFPTRQELASRLDDPTLTILDVRREEEYNGKGGSACDPRQGHIPGARRLQVDELYGPDGRPKAAEEIRALVGDAQEVVAYCHSGSRSALATLALRSAGYDARNYAGSWHEWSRHQELPIER